MQTWDGKLTPEIRKKLQEKRGQLGASCQSVGAVLKVTESIVLKWESGKVRRVSVTFRPRVAAFLSGVLDSQFPDWKGTPSGQEINIGETGNGNQKPIPPELRAVFDHLSVVYKACRVKPEAQTELLLELEKTADAVLSRLASGK